MSFPLEEIFQKNPLWKKVCSVLNKLNEKGHHSVIAGGAVRDALLGRIPKDFDIATKALPEQVLALFPYAKEVGKSFGVIHLPALKGQGIEIASFRKDGSYLDGRHPSSIEFCSIEEDARRRDFTINALYYDIHQHKVLDFVEGVKDLERKIIRTVGSAQERFKEDHLRVLRAIRFAVRTEFSIEEETLKQMKTFTVDLKKISKERILDELDNTFKHGNFTSTVGYLRDIKFFQVIGDFWPKEQPDFWTIENQKRSLYFWWSLFLFPVFLKNQKNLSLLLKDSTFSFSKERISQIKRFFIFYTEINSSHIRKGRKFRLLCQREGKEYLDLTFHIQKFYGEKINLDPLLKEYQKILVENKLPSPFLNGDDLIQLGISQGPQFSVLLEKIYDDQLEGKVRSREEALAALQRRG